MKKTLFSAALLAISTITPCCPGVLGAIDIPSRASDIACAIASPLFWHIYDEILTSSLARLTAGAEQPAEPHTSQADAVACVFVQIVLNRAFGGSLTATQKFDVMSIPRRLIRRTIERRSAGAQKWSASTNRS
jgi:hypothetical protein